MIDGIERGWQLPTEPGEAPSSWVIFQGNGFRIGAIRAPARHPRWKRVNHIPGLPVLLFPRRPVRIAPTSGGGGVIDAGCALFLDSEERYERACMSEEGDLSDWYAFDEALLARLAPSPQPSHAGTRSQRIDVSARAYALQRRAFRHALVDPAPDELLIEEALCSVLDGLRSAGARPAGTPSRGGARLSNALRELLGARFREGLRLADLAGELGVTAPHLCHVFQRETGSTIHDQRERLRFAAALESFEEGESDLTRLALDLGYSSHAHFTANFSRAHGRAPSRLRAAIRSGRLDA